MFDDEDLYREMRGRLFGIAYRLLGSAAEAEDVVHDAFVRLANARAGGVAVDSPAGFLVTATTRIGIDRLRSARVRREQYPGQWLPEPVVEVADDDPAGRVEAADSISLAFLLVLERLGPVERAVFVLRDVFDYDYDEVGQVVDRSPESCRQIALRARRHVGEGRQRYAVDPAQRDAVADRFARVWEDADLSGLLELLAPEVVLTGDGGGKAPALPRPLAGAERVARALVGFARVMHEHGLVARATTLNGDAGVFAVDVAGEVRAALALELGPQGVLAVRSQVNPHKLGHLSAPPA
jgi:RNA polymerase sigma-70 factor (ECF subfamily)